MPNEHQTGEETLLHWVQKRFPDSPRKRLKEWIVSGRIQINGKPVTRAGLRMGDPGDQLTLGHADTSLAAWTHRKKIHPKLSVLHLDDSLAIVDKSYGLLSIPVEDHPGESALSVLGDYLNDPRGDAQRKRLFGSTAHVTPLPVHRLDQYTSGLLCLALNPKARRVLIDQLHRHEILREYIAFCDGRARKESGTWKHYLKLDKAGYKQSLYNNPSEGTTVAITHYAVEHYFKRNRVSKLVIQLETGLKHQIRIQAAAEGLPLIGDRIYHEATREAVARKGAKLPYGFRRQALHASVIGLKHPVTGQDLRFESRLHADMQRLEERLD
jgi:23S rRNA pseudouridine1911/1915/1917 synthase